MDLNPGQLDALVAIADHGSFEAAAASRARIRWLTALGVTRSSVAAGLRP